MIFGGTVASASLINRTPRTTLSSLQCPFWGSEKPINTCDAAPILPLVRRSLSSMAAAFLRESPPAAFSRRLNKIAHGHVAERQAGKNLSVIFLFSLCQNWISSLILMRLGSGGEAVSVCGPQHHITCCPSPTCHWCRCPATRLKKLCFPRRTVFDQGAIAYHSWVLHIFPFLFPFRLQ